MKISIGCDHGAIGLKNVLLEHLTNKGYEVKDFGTYTTASCDYPEFAKAAAEAVRFHHRQQGQGHPLRSAQRSDVRPADPGA